MPVPTSQRMFRFLQAVAHGKAKRANGLKPAQAKAGLGEFKASGKSYSALPASRANAVRAGQKKGMKR